MAAIMAHTPSKQSEFQVNEKAKAILTRIPIFLGETRDGLTMLNMQNLFLVVARHYTEKQAGLMFFVFGLSQFIFQTPAGYIMDGTEKKVLLLGLAAIGTVMLLMITIFCSHEGGVNTYLPNFIAILFVRFVQGAVTSLIPPGVNGISQGIVGVKGMTHQVANNESNAHLGTSIMFITGSIVAYYLYPNIGVMFLMSPLFLCGTLYFLTQIKEDYINHNEARGSAPSGSDSAVLTPMQVMKDPLVIAFVIICFAFHLANEVVLPLVMQTLAIGNGRGGVLLSGFCVIVAQAGMVVTAKFCGKYAGTIGRKPLFLMGLLALSIRCFILVTLLTIRGDTGVGDNNADGGIGLFDCLILSTQILDGVGAGVFGTMYILVTSDLAAGTGRFNFTLGLTSAAWSIGGTISGLLGQIFAADFGYLKAFEILGYCSLVPVLLYIFVMPETLISDEKDEKDVTDEKTKLLNA